MSGGRLVTSSTLSDPIAEFAAMLDDVEDEVEDEVVIGEHENRLARR